MAFIDKKDPVVVNIMLTSKGREQLSKGLLNFKYFAIGDSEMDYEFNKNSKINPFNSLILRPKDKNPNQLSFITRNLSGDPYNIIGGVPSIPRIIENHIKPIGFFNDSSTEFLTDSDHVKQPDVAIDISTVTGGTILNLIKAPTYLANVNEPEENDLILVKWTNPSYIFGDTTGYTINKNNPTPYLTYKIQEIISGSLSNNTLKVRVDRELPNFNGSGNTFAGALVYYNFINYTGDTCYSTDDTEDALIAFLQNCQCPTVRFPFWNMSIIFTENIVGVQTDDKQFGDYNTNELGGFVSYIQNQSPTNKKLGVIHYTNNSVANTYAEGFYGDPENSNDIDNVPKLTIPTIMWHKSSETTLGVNLKAVGSLKYITGTTRSLNTRYFDLSDNDGNIIGKVFYDLKIFVIEDQELLFAMSYKSNRSWTLPNYGVDINANVTFGCPNCVLEYQTGNTTPTTIGGSDGTLTVFNITNNVGDFTDNEIILKVFKGGSTGERIYFDSITGDTTISNLSPDTYYIEVIDLGAPKCVVTGETTISNPISTLSIVDQDSGYGNLIPYFETSAYQNNPSRIRITESQVAPNGFIGGPGNGWLTIAPTGSTNVEINSRTQGSNPLLNWVVLADPSVIDTNALTFKEAYTIYVRDITGGTLTINSPEVVNSQVWTYHVAVGNPFNLPSNIGIITGTDSGGKYVTVSNYLTTIDNNNNPIVGEIEFSVHGQNDEPYVWNGSDNDGQPIKLYYTETGSLRVTIRERLDYITIYNVKSNTFNG
ncbi:MAG: hypothetical protein ACOC33_01125 [bacterium]